MKPDTTAWWANECRAPFEALNREFGFSGPVQTNAANEYTVHYRKGNRTVNVVFVPGATPFVELFYPAEKIEHRRFVKGASSLGSEKTDEVSELEKLLRLRAHELLANERKFLNAENGA